MDWIFTWEFLHAVLLGGILVVSLLPARGRERVGVLAFYGVLLIAVLAVVWIGRWVLAFVLVL